MSDKRYADKFKAEAAKQVVDQGRSVLEVSTWLGVSINSLYAWVGEQRKVPAARHADVSLAAENRRLQAELKRVTEKCDILKWPPRILPRDKSEVRVHAGASGRVPRGRHVSCAGCAAQRVLRVAEPAA